MIDNEQLIKKIKQNIKDMHSFKDPVLIENVKKIVKKNVKLFDRGSLLAYILMQGVSFSKDISDSKNVNKKIVKKNNDNIVQLWTNAYFYNNEKAEEFIAFVSSTSSVPKDKIKRVKKVRNFSFIEVESDFVDKILSSFRSPVQFEKLKVSIKPVKREG